MTLSFILQSLLDSGSYGSIYQAEYKNSCIRNRPIAVKVIPLKSTNNFKQKYMIETEHQIWKKLSGKSGILTLNSVEYDNTHAYMVCEYMKRGSLQDMIKNKVEFSSKDIKNVTSSILKGINVCHSNNICHSDIKPANILLSNSEKILDTKLCDFGKSQENDNDFDGLCDRSGTIYFTSPEIFNRTSYGNNIDVWALGIIVFMLFYKGMHPFPFDKKNKLITFDERYIKWDQNAILSLEAKDFISKCIKIEKYDRLSSNELMSHPFINR